MGEDESKGRVCTVVGWRVLKEMLGLWRRGGERATRKGFHDGDADIQLPGTREDVLRRVLIEHVEGG